MLGWLLSLLMTVVFALGSLTPGGAERALEKELEQAVGGGAKANVRLQGDPLLQLPLGHIPEITATLHRARFGLVPVHELKVRVTDLRLAPGALWLKREAQLRAPAPASVEARVRSEDLQSTLSEAIGLGLLKGIRMDFSLFGRRLGGELDVRDARLRLSPGRITLTGTAGFEGAALRWPFEAAAGLSVVDGRRIILSSPSLSLAGRPLPDALVAPQIEALNPLLDLNQLGLGGDRWRMGAIEIQPEGITLRAAGELLSIPDSKQKP